MVPQNNLASLTPQGIPLILPTDCFTADPVNSFTDDTEQFAELNGVKAQSVRKRYAQTGSYFGIQPLKLANRRLKWPHVFAAKGVI
ncbi:hypothetical protein [Paraburkholderia fynbosensis]|uniref:Uncharacterized protein n=1 Tax=Paraburkholderia fynbosensis TaxID=1200993 RepID=A0A6J5G3Q9_9BURK|nr:hypothetical protein [Paraburkholderia fynbosensis]CAB3790888.1 hypothetical protein LMG27177_02938 [Paraburkholderia fynbosensis]